MVVIFLYLATVCTTFGVEAIGGIVVPGIPETHGPAVFCEFRASVAITENWSIFASAPLWKLTNFDPSTNSPDFDFAGNDYEYMYNYSECRRGIQMGVRRKLGPVSLETAAGIVKRKANYTLAGADVDGCGDVEYVNNQFLCSIGIVIPTGDFGQYNLAVRATDFRDWFVTAGAGLRISFGKGGD